jgi:hypothetical protein
LQRTKRDGARDLPGPPHAPRITTAIFRLWNAPDPPNIAGATIMKKPVAVTRARKRPRARSSKTQKQAVDYGRKVVVKFNDDIALPDDGDLAKIVERANAPT